MDTLPDNHSAALDVICAGDPELLRLWEETQADFALRYPGLSPGQHLAMVRACFEHFWTDGVRAERSRCEALLKMLRPETRDLVLAAIADGRPVGDILDQAVALIQNPAKARASDWRPGSTEKVEALASALAKRRPRHTHSRVNGSSKE